jgi:hypothetical protein
MVRASRRTPQASKGTVTHPLPVTVPLRRQSPHAIGFRQQGQITCVFSSTDLAAMARGVPRNRPVLLVDPPVLGTISTVLDVQVPETLLQHG